MGLALALGLARAGRRVLVLEKEPHTAEHSRAPAIWPRTQEVLASLGVLDRFLARGLRLGRVRLADADRGGVLLSLPLEELAGETAFPWLLIVPQSVTERLLLEALREEPSARVLFSREVVGVEATERSVRLRHRVTGEGEGGGRKDGGAEEDGHVEAAFAVGCDGARSTVREALGAAFEGETYGARAALADLRLRDDRDLPFPRLSTRSGAGGRSRGA